MALHWRQRPLRHRLLSAAPDKQISFIPPRLLLAQSRHPQLWFEMSAFGSKADEAQRGRRCPLLTQNGRYCDVTLLEVGRALASIRRGSPH